MPLNSFQEVVHLQMFTEFKSVLREVTSILTYSTYQLISRRSAHAPGSAHYISYQSELFQIVPVCLFSHPICTLRVAFVSPPGGAGAARPFQRQRETPAVGNGRAGEAGARPIQTRAAGAGAEGETAKPREFFPLFSCSAALAFAHESSFISWLVEV